jgi:hypothetical protein
MEVSEQLHDPAILPPRKEAPGTHGIGGPQIRSGRCREEKNPLSLPSRPALSPPLHRLNYPGSYIGFNNTTANSRMMLRQ